MTPPLGRRNEAISKISMAKVEVFIGSEIVSANTFWRSFYVFQDYSSGKLFWHSGDEEAEVGIYKLWIQQADTAPRIAFVLPDWLLIIDGVQQEQKIYEDVDDLAGKVVELLHEDYRFVFHFD
jgi:hypothetical protein